MALADTVVLANAGDRRGPRDHTHAVLWSPTLYWDPATQMLAVGNSRGAPTSSTVSYISSNVSADVAVAVVDARAVGSAAQERTVLQIKRTTTGNEMADGFGGRIDFVLQDIAGVNNIVARIIGKRAGADNQGQLVLQTAVAGTLVTRAILGSALTPVGFNVREYGAVGDGSTNDTAAFQAAITDCVAAAHGAALLIPPGDYLVTGNALSITTTDGSTPEAGTMSIRGAGVGATTLRSTSGTTLAINGRRPIEIDGMTIVAASGGTGVSVTAPVIAGPPSNSNLNTHSRITSVFFDGGGIGLDLLNTQEAFIVSACTFYNQSGISLRTNAVNATADNGGATVAACRFEGSGGATTGIKLVGGNLKMTGTKFIGHFCALHIAPESNGNISEVAVSACSLTASSTGSVAVLIELNGTGSVGAVQLVGNTIDSNADSILISGSGSGIVSFLTIVGNSIRTLGSGVSCIGVLRPITGGNISGNVFDTQAANAAINVVHASTQGVLVAHNTHQNFVTTNLYLGTLYTLVEAFAGGLPIAQLLGWANGSQVYCSDCTFANPCAGGGSGAIAKRLNGAWRCD